MDKRSEQALHSVDLSVNGIRGVYAAWARRSGVSYHELLVLYALRDMEVCTQRKICESYILPKQTVHNIVSSYVGKGYLRMGLADNRNNEKALVLTQAGRERMREVMTPIEETEEKALAEFGIGNLEEMTKLALGYRAILERLFA